MNCIAQQSHTIKTRFFSTSTRPNIDLVFKVGKWYSKSLDEQPLLTKAVTCGFLAAGGDLICQRFIERQEGEGFSRFWQRWDRLRTLRFGILGVTLVAPAIHYWYGALAAWVPGKSVVDALKRVALDQFVFTPLFVPVFVSSLATLEGRVDGLFTRLVDSVPGIVAANWALWIPAQSLNFYFTPVKYQVLFSNVVSLAWNAYLSFKTAHKKVPKTA